MCISTFRGHISSFFGRNPTRGDIGGDDDVGGNDDDDVAEEHGHVRDSYRI